MVTQTTIEFDDLLLESEVHELIDELTEVIDHIYKSIPNEILLTPSGEANVRSRYGAIYFHCMMARASLKALV